MRKGSCFLLLAIVLMFSLSPQAVLPVWGYRTVRRLHRLTVLTKYDELTAEQEDLLNSLIKEARSILYQEFMWDPQPVLRIVVDPQLLELNISGYYQLGKIVVAPPLPGKFTEYKAKSPILHEMSHLVVDYLAHGNYPSWLTEGIAVYLEVKYQGGTWVDVQEQRIWQPVHLLDAALHSSSEEIQAAAYWQAYKLIEYLYNRDPHGVRALLGELGRGETLENALLKIYTLTVDKLAQQALLSLSNQQEAVP